uniref:ADP-ribosyl cyclase/cyclic ADP-ribose hydrolase n=1 Tax=Pipistrellus kuhlii TaxID=59472 RepID=A0A7J8AYV3_PIPKU|nr:hypothetical protein mPipKuh1_001578 [Pipistrellus kuhlii]
MAVSDRALSWPSLLLQVLLLAPCWAGAQCTRWSGKGTTPHLRSIFLGRCGEYIDLLQPQLRDKNCTAMWEAFQLALTKDPCSVLPSDYDRFIDLARHPIPRDKWRGAAGEPLQPLSVVAVVCGGCSEQWVCQAVGLAMVRQLPLEQGISLHRAWNRFSHPHHFISE